MNSREEKEAARNFLNEVAITKRSLKMKAYKKITSSVNLDDGLYSASTLIESLNWQRAVVESVSVPVFKAFLWNHIPTNYKYPKVMNGYTKMLAVFYTLAEMSVFFEACFGVKYFKTSQTVGNEVSTIFVCPYGTIKSSFLEADLEPYRELYKAQGWRPVMVNTNVNTGKLLASYKQLNPQLCFIVEELNVPFNGTTGVFFRVVVPDENAGIANLMPGVSFHGLKGVVPASCIAQRNARLPSILYKANPKELNKVVFGFRSMQVIGNKLTWKVKPLLQTADTLHGVEVTMHLPEGFSRAHIEINNDDLEDGYLTNLNVLFKLFDDEWKWFKVGQFIPVTSRTPELPFSYTVRVVGGPRGELPVFFDSARYNPQATADAQLGTWFLLCPGNNIHDDA